MTERLLLFTQNYLGNKWGGEKKTSQGTTVSQGVFSRMDFPSGAAPGGQPGFAQALQQTQPPCRSKQSHFYYFSPRNSGVIWQPHTLDKPRTAPAPTHTGTAPLPSGTGRVVPLQLGRKFFSKVFTESEKKLQFIPDLSLTKHHSTQGKAQLEAEGQLRIRSFLHQDFPPNTPDASGGININLAFDQLLLAVPHSLFSHCFHCGQFELFRTENERSFPQAELWYVHELPGPGSRGNWGFLGISGDFGGISGDFYAKGTHLTAEEDPESQDWGVNTYRGTHTHQNPAHALRMHWIWIISF